MKTVVTLRAWVALPPGPDPAEQDAACPFALAALIEPFILVAFMVVLGFIIVPSHWTSIWMDREFTGWVAPIANRLSAGLKLYADGGHVPMPPLPFVSLHLLAHGRALWLTESLCNFVFQALTLLLMYIALGLVVRRPVPFLATLVAMPIFFSLPKTIVYDSMAQFHVALLGVLVVCHSRGQAVSNTILNELGLRQRGLRAALSMMCRPSLILMGLVTADCVLTKQSTGTGAFLGGFVAVTCFSSRTRWQRLGEGVAFVAWTAIAFALLVVALSPWIDIPGFVRDVFLTGSEPKGGSFRLLKSLVVYALQIGHFALLVAITLSVALAATRASVRSLGAAAPEIAGEEPHRRWRLTYPVALLPVLLVLALSPLVKESNRLVQMANLVAIHILWIGLLAGLLMIATALVSKISNRLPGFASLALEPAGAEGNRAARLAGLGCVLLVSAVFHSLSTPNFRWIYDNNPLIVFAAAMIFTIALDYTTALVAPASPRGRLIFAAVLFATLLFPWANFAAQLASCRRCTEAWPEVEYLAGARLMTGARGMRRLVAVVRDLTPNADSDTALLLPNDPNVEAWFARPRPELSSPIIFADQYWDRYVSEDVEALRRQLPRVIVIGPRRYWRHFHRIWQEHYGAERLIDAVRKEILPQHYALHERVAIKLQGMRDYMDVYVRKE
jgi:hypothetical protein